MEPGQLSEWDVDELEMVCRGLRSTAMDATPHVVDTYARVVRWKGESRPIDRVAHLQSAFVYSGRYLSVGDFSQVSLAVAGNLSLHVVGLTWGESTFWLVDSSATYENYVK
jgi:hypothetical protein